MNERGWKRGIVAVSASAVAVAVPLLAIASACLAGIAHVMGWGSRAQDAFGQVWVVCGFACLPIALLALTLSVRALIAADRKLLFGVLTALDVLAAAIGTWIYMAFCH